MDKCSEHKLRVPLHEEIMRQRRQLESYFAGAKKEDVAEYEMSLLAMIAEKQLPISLVDTLVPLLRKLHPKDERLKKVQLARTKASTIISDGN